jgi:hypothetical protein
MAAETAQDGKKSSYTPSSGNSSDTLLKIAYLNLAIFIRRGVPLVQVKLLVNASPYFQAPFSREIFKFFVILKNWIAG